MKSRVFCLVVFMGMSAGLEARDAVTSQLIGHKSDEMALFNIQVGIASDINWLQLASTSDGKADYYIFDLGAMIPYILRAEFNQPFGALSATAVNQFFKATMTEFDNSPVTMRTTEIGFELYLTMSETTDPTQVTLASGATSTHTYRTYITPPGVQRRMLTLRAGYFDRTHPAIIGERFGGYISDYHYTGKLESRGYYLGLGRKTHERVTYNVAGYGLRSNQTTLRNYGLDILFGNTEVKGAAPEAYQAIDVDTADWGVRLSARVQRHALALTGEVGKRPGFADDWYCLLSLGIGYSGGSVKLR